MGKRMLDDSIELKDNAMLKHAPELFCEWDFKKNAESGLDVYKITQGSGKKAWWNCPNCESSYDMEIYARVGKKKVKCPYCSGRRVNHTNSLVALSPMIAEEWHPTKNKETIKETITNQSNQKIWWLGKCGHEWKTGVANRTISKTGCPYCSNKKVLVGFNDMWSTNPELAKQLANPEDGYNYTKVSGKKVDWKCGDCKNIIKSKQISNVSNRGLFCQICSDGIKFPEKFMFNLLKEYGINFQFNTVQGWSDGKRYDFYLPDYKWIIETHGEQHYDEAGFSSMGGRTLEEEEENDRLKEKMAKESGIDQYIIIDCRHSTVEWMKSSILNSDIIKLIPTIDFERIGQLASNSFVRKACDLWNSGIRNAPIIAEKMGLANITIINYLKRGAEIGWCDYCPKEASSISGAFAGTESGKSTIQLTKDYLFIKEWESSTEASLHLGIGNSNISAVCRGVRPIAGGCRWMYKEDYIKLTEDEKEKLRKLDVVPNTRKRAVYQLDRDGKIIDYFDSITEAVSATGVMKVWDVCSGKREIAGGCKWMYKEDYDALQISKRIS